MAQIKCVDLDGIHALIVPAEHAASRQEALEVARKNWYGWWADEIKVDELTTTPEPGWWRWVPGNNWSDYGIVLVAAGKRERGAFLGWLVETK